MHSSSRQDALVLGEDELRPARDIGPRSHGARIQVDPIPSPHSAADGRGVRPGLEPLPRTETTSSCIGAAFSMMEAQLVAAIMVQRFRPRLLPGQTIVPGAGVLLKPRYGVKAQYEPVRA
jgi:hypothetical protein